MYRDKTLPNSHSITGLISANDEPCENYQELTDWHRSAGFKTDLDHADICDRDLEAGWYRATSGAGGDMPSSFPGYHHCGTFFPIWLNGKNP